MRWNPLITVIILLMSCNNTPSGEQKADEKINTAKEIEPIQKDLIDSIVSSFNLRNLLTETSLNSGVASGDKFTFDPDTIGYFYNFYDPDLQKVEVNVNGESSNNDEPKWFNMTIFKFGENTTNFDKQEHLLIELQSFEPDENLGTLNLIGTNVQPFLNYYKLNVSDNDNIEITTNSYNLTLTAKDSIIQSFKLVRIN